MDNTNQQVGSKLPWQKLLFASLTITTSLFLLLYLNFEPYWETDDDIAMSMVTHGYGIAAEASSNIIFSNVIWGHLAKLTPDFNGTSGYSSATIGILIITGTTILFGMLRFQLGSIIALSTLTLIILRPALFPQFTINSGLAFVCAIICWHLYSKNNDWRTCFCGCIFSYLSFVIRSQEFLLVALIALPLLQWRLILKARTAKLSFIALLIAITASIFIDRQSYQTTEWKEFTQFNPARAPYTDFGAGPRLAERPDIMQEYNYSVNDISLISNWFFADPKIASPAPLVEMFNKLGPLPKQNISISNGLTGIEGLWHPRLLPLTLAALLLSILTPSWRVASSWTLAISAVFLLGYLGRPSILRVYVPVVSLLVIAPFLCGSISGWRKRLSAGILLIAALANTLPSFSASDAINLQNTQIRENLKGFPQHPVVAWGGGFPFVAAYPVLSPPPQSISYKFYALGVFTLAPFSTAYKEEQVGNHLIDNFTQGEGINIIASDQKMKLLETYCKEHFQGVLQTHAHTQFGKFAVKLQKCTSKQTH